MITHLIPPDEQELPHPLEIGFFPELQELPQGPFICFPPPEEQELPQGPLIELLQEDEMLLSSAAHELPEIVEPLCCFVKRFFNIIFKLN